jgi:hypothetical protein
MFAGVMGMSEQLRLLQSTYEHHQEMLDAFASVRQNVLAGAPVSGTMRTLDDDDPPPPPAACTPLLQALYNTFTQDQTCFAFFQSKFPVNATTKAEITTYLNNYCTSPCLGIMINHLKAIGACYVANGLSDPYIKIGDYMHLTCMKNPATGDYCFATILDPALKNLISGSQTLNSTITSICYIYSQYGCCLTSFFLSGPANLTSGSFQNFFRGFCGFHTFPPPCPRAGEIIKLVKASWRIKGIAYAYFEQNKEKVASALRSDIATRISQDESLIAFSGFRSGSLIADFTIRGTDDANTDAIGAAVATASKDTTVTFPALAAAVGTDGLESSTSTLGIDTAQSSSTVTTYSPDSGSHVQPMFGMVLALFAFAFVFRQ